MADKPLPEAFYELPEWVTPSLKTAHAELLIRLREETTGQSWGNATADTRIDAALAWLRANTTATSDPPLLVGASEGACDALTYASDHPVAGVIGIIPAIDIQAMRVADTLGLRAAIDAAWGVTYPAALPAGANPATLTAALSSVPQQHWYASNDTVSANIAAYAAAVGADLRNVGALGHTDAAIAAVAATDVLTFINAL